MSQTATIEASPVMELGHVSPKDNEKSSNASRSGSTIGGDDLPSADNQKVDDRAPEVGVVDGGDDAAPENAQRQAERWNSPKGNVPRLAFVFVAFIIMGMNDAAVGVCLEEIPYPTSALLDRWANQCIPA